MMPVLFSIGSLHIYSFGAMVALGVFLSLQLMNRRAVKDGFPQVPEVADLLFITVFMGFIGSRIHYVLQNWQWYIERPLEIFHIWEGGLIFYGGVIGAMASLVIYMKLKKIPLLKGYDFLFPYLALSHAFGRLGCFLNGCCYGRPCELPWATRFPGLPGPVHPTQIYEAILDFLLFFFLSRAYSRKRYDGQIIALYFVFYGMIRFVVEIFRADNPEWNGLTFNQWISLAFILSGILAHFFASRKKGQVL